MNNTLKPARIKDLFLNLLFPRFCVGCQEEGDWLCSHCAQNIVPVVSQVCPECGKLSEHGQYHVKCKEGITLKGIIAAAYFEEGPVREMIHNLKYNGVIELVEPLAGRMASSLMSNFKLLMSNEMPNDKLEIRNLKLVISFAPLHWKRKAQRGYNQAELLARAVGEKLDMPVYNLLKKTKNTKRQAGLGGKDRRKNLEGVFRLDLSHLSNLRNLRVLLVDDVYTTGSTLNECARVLKKAGAKEVWGLTVTRG